ncbi:MAG: imidazolonepropionase [Thermoplasmata archaeon]|nr:imidazolonepropionase [Thermoplasmata archaeon]
MTTIRAELVVTGIGELATLSVGPVPRTGKGMGELGIIDGGALAVRDGRFVFVGRESTLRRLVRLRRGGATIDAEGGVVVPGFVDPHTHVLFAGHRAHEVPLKIRGASYAEIARQGGGLFSTVRATRRATRPELLRSAGQRLDTMLRCGTTSAEVKSGYALTHTGELRLLGLIPELRRRSGMTLVPTYLGAHAIPPEFTRTPDDYVREMVARTLPEVARRHLARYCDVFCEPGFFSVPQSERLLRGALKLGLGVKVHADEFVLSGGAQLAARLGARSADHLLKTPKADMGKLARAGVVAVVLPVTPFASLSGTASPGRELVDAGAAVAVGSDLSPNSWVESMPSVLFHAVHGARLTPAEALSAATVNAAQAIGEEATAGQIALGRPADFSVFHLEEVEELGYRASAIPAHVSRQGITVSSR